MVQPADELAAAPHIERVEHLLQMILHGVRRDAELAHDLLGRVSAYDQFGDLDFARRQPVRKEDNGNGVG